MNIDQETARNLFEAGGVFLFLDVPSDTEFGIDYNCWRTGVNFKGVKMIPPGLHFIYYNVVDKYGNVGIRNGFFHNFKLKEMLVKKWNKQTETIDDYEFSENEIESFRSNKQDLDRFLGAYPFEEYKRWLSLTNHLNEELVMKLMPNTGIISSASTLIGKSFKSGFGPKKAQTSEPTTSNIDNLFNVPSNLQEAEKRLPEMSIDKDTSIKFTKIPTTIYPKGSNAVEITKYSIDLSYQLDQMINQYQSDLNIQQPNEINILCELQFSFVCFLIGQVYDAFEQWKHLVNLLSNSDKAIEKYPNLFIQFIKVLYFQLKEMPDDFFSDIILRNNFLTLNLHNLFDNINETVETNKTSSNLVLFKELNNRSEQFKNYLQERFQLDFDLEPDEYAPLVCEEENKLDLN